jgi:hypothetical protein
MQMIWFALEEYDWAFAYTPSNPTIPGRGTFTRTSVDAANIARRDQRRYSLQRYSV